jgi:hypothetical protein
MSNSQVSTFLKVSEQYGDALVQRTIGLGNLRAFAFSRGDTLYAGTTTGKLYRISLASGDTTYVGTAPSTAYSAFSFRPSTGMLWASVRPPIANRDKIYTVSTATGEATLVGGTGDNAVTPSITFGPSGILYGLKGISTQTNTLILIDTLTAAGTTIGSTAVTGLQAIAMRTDSSVSNVQGEHKSGIPLSFALHQNYPNPFNPATRIEYDVPVASRVRLLVYDLIGRGIATLVDENQSPGFKSIDFHSGELASGIYFYRLSAGAYTATKKLLIVK